MEPRPQPIPTRSVVGLLTAAGAEAMAVALLTTVLGKQVFDLTGSPLALGLLGLAEFAPAALLVFVTGTLADRLDRRRLPRCRDQRPGRWPSACSPGTPGTNPTSTLPIFLLVIAFGTAARSRPRRLARSPPTSSSRAGCRGSSPRQIGDVAGRVDRRPRARRRALRRERAAAVRRGRAAARGRAIAILFGSADPPRSRRSRSPSGGIHEAVEGVRFIRTQPILLGAISLDLFAVLFGGAVALLPAIAAGPARRRRGRARLAARRRSASAPAPSRCSSPSGRCTAASAARLLVVVALFGVGTIVLGATTSFAVAFVALLVLVGRRLGERVHPLDARPPRDAARQARPGARGRSGVHRRVERARRVRVGSRRPAPRRRPLAVVLGGVGTLCVSAALVGVFPALRNVDEFPVAREPSA